VQHGLSEWNGNGGVVYVWQDRYSGMKVLRVYYMKLSINFKLHIKKEAIRIHDFLILVYIQGDLGGICNTLGNDSMCDSKQKSSYKHVSDFRRLRSYEHF
jgi:hypothetical protein